MSTVRDLLSGSLRLIGVIATGETPEASDLTDAMKALNLMLDSWSNDNLIVHNQVREVFPLVAGQAQYTMGSGGNFDTVRPTDIIDARIQESANPDPVEFPLKICTVEEFANIFIKGTQSTLPTHIYKEGTFPLETFQIYPVPSVSKNLVLYTNKPLTTFTNLSTTISFPPGYERAIKYNLALEIAPEYGLEPSPRVDKIASDSLETLMDQNSREHFLGCDDAIAGSARTWNYRTGGYE